MPTLRASAALVIALAIAACSTGGRDDAGPSNDDAGVDGGTQCSPNLPPSSAACLEGQCGNELGVGQQCTPGGGECADLFDIGGAFLCTGDYGESDLVFCTKPCVLDDQCGTNAYCAVDPENPGRGSGCFPESCRGDEPDGGVDAGPTDAGADGDAGASDAG